MTTYRGSARAGQSKIRLVDDDVGSGGDCGMKSFDDAVSTLRAAVGEADAAHPIIGRTGLDWLNGRSLLNLLRLLGYQLCVKRRSSIFN